MPFLLQYLLKLSLTLGVLYMFYYAVLRNLTFHTWNRFYLLGYSLIAWVIPFVNVTPWIREEPDGGDALLYQMILTSRLSRLPANPGTFTFPVSLYSGVIGLLAIGSGVMVIRFLYQLFSIWSIKRRATLIKSDKISLYHVSGDISPFSFAQSIFINTQLHSEQDLQKIIEHEFVHVKQRHTVDLMLAELLCIVNWYNPFAWMIKKAIRQNLEFIADNSVLETGVDAREYQYLLLKVTGLQPYSISNNFTISSLKKRIQMMNKIRSAKVQLVKFLFAVPLLAVMLLAFRSRQEQQRQAAAPATSFNQPLSSDTVPPPPPAKDKQGQPVPPPPPPKVEVVHFAPPKGLHKDVVSNKVTVTLKNGTKEVYDLEKPAERKEYEKRYGMPTPPPPPPALKETSGTDKVVIGHAKGDGTTFTGKDVKEVTVTGHPGPGKSNTLQEVMITGSGARKTGNDPLYVVDGVLASKSVMENTEPDAIYSINVLKGEKATELFGDKGLNGVVLVTTKGNAAITELQKGDTSKDAHARINVPSNFKGMLIVDGKVVSPSQFNQINPMTVESMTVLKDQSAVATYGEKARDGVILIRTKGK